VANDLLNLDDQLCFALYRASRAVIRAYTPSLTELGLTYPQYLVMLVLWELDGISVSDIGQRLILDSATLTPLLKKLEQRKFITRRRSKSDERIVNIYLTTSGKALRENAKEVPLALACTLDMDVNAKSDRDQVRKLRGELQALAWTIESKETLAKKF
jgi:DNA-binding MarR family transcriptional regulator